MKLLISDHVVRGPTCAWNQLYLSAELEVDHDDGDLWARDDEDDEHEEQKPKHVVELILPDRLHPLQQSGNNQ